MIWKRLLCKNVDLRGDRQTLKIAEANLIKARQETNNQSKSISISQTSQGKRRGNRFCNELIMHLYNQAK